MAGMPFKKSSTPGVSIRQLVEKVPEGCSMPGFEQKPVPLALQEGKNATFRAVVCGDPRPQVHWQSTKGDLRDSSKYQISLAPGSKEHVLQIQKLTGEDADLYRCTAINVYGEAVCCARLTVIEVGFRKNQKRHKEPQEDLRKELAGFRNLLKKRIPPPTPEKKVDSDQVWQLLMAADRKDYEQICWKYGIVDFRGLLRKLREMSQEQEDRMAQYVSTISNTRHIRVTKEGVATFDLELELKDPESKIYLYKDGEMIPYGHDNQTRHCLRRLGRSCLFRIQDLRPEDAGTYQVKVEDAEVFSTQLEPAAIPSRVVSPLVETCCEAGGDAIFECTLSSPCPRAAWHFQHRPLLPSDRHQASVSPDGLTHWLVVRGACLADMGLYSLGTGLHTSSAWLVVEGADRQQLPPRAEASGTEDPRRVGSKGGDPRHQGPKGVALKEVQIPASPDTAGSGGHSYSTWSPRQMKESLLEAEGGRVAPCGDSLLHREGSGDRWGPSLQEGCLGSQLSLVEGQQQGHSRDGGGNRCWEPRGHREAVWGPLQASVEWKGHRDDESQLRQCQEPPWGTGAGPEAGKMAQDGPVGGWGKDEGGGDPIRDRVCRAPREEWCGGTGLGATGDSKGSGGPGASEPPSGSHSDSKASMAPRSWGSAGSCHADSGELGGYWGTGGSLQTPASQAFQELSASGGRTLFLGHPEAQAGALLQEVAGSRLGESVTTEGGYETSPRGARYLEDSERGPWELRGREGQNALGTLSESEDGSRSFQCPQDWAASQSGEGGLDRLNSESTSPWPNAGSGLSKTGVCHGPEALGYGGRGGAAGDGRVARLMGSGQGAEDGNYRAMEFPGCRQGLGEALGDMVGLRGLGAPEIKPDFWNGSWSSRSKGLSSRGTRAMGSGHSHGPGHSRGLESENVGDHIGGSWLSGEMGSLHGSGGQVTSGELGRIESKGGGNSRDDPGVPRGVWFGKKGGSGPVGRESGGAEGFKKGSDDPEGWSGVLGPPLSGGQLHSRGDLGGSSGLGSGGEAGSIGDLGGPSGLGSGGEAGSIGDLGASSGLGPGGEAGSRSEWGGSSGLGSGGEAGPRVHTDGPAVVSMGELGLHPKAKEAPRDQGGTGPRGQPCPLGDLESPGPLGSLDRSGLGVSATVEAVGGKHVGAGPEGSGRIRPPCSQTAELGGFSTSEAPGAFGERVHEDGSGGHGATWSRSLRAGVRARDENRTRGVRGYVWGPEAVAPHSWISRGQWASGPASMLGYGAEPVSVGPQQIGSEVTWGGGARSLGAGGLGPRGPAGFRGDSGGLGVMGSAAEVGYRKDLGNPEGVGSGSKGSYRGGLEGPGVVRPGGERGYKGGLRGPRETGLGGEGDYSSDLRGPGVIRPGVEGDYRGVLGGPGETRSEGEGDYRAVLGGSGGTMSEGEGDYRAVLGGPRGTRSEGEGDYRDVLGGPGRIPLGSEAGYSVISGALSGMGLGYEVGYWEDSGGSKGVGPEGELGYKNGSGRSEAADSPVGVRCKGELRGQAALDLRAGPGSKGDSPRGSGVGAAGRASPRVDSGMAGRLGTGGGIAHRGSPGVLEEGGIHRGPQSLPDGGISRSDFRGSGPSGVDVALGAFVWKEQLGAREWQVVYPGDREAPSREARSPAQAGASGPSRFFDGRETVGDDPQVMMALKSGPEQHFWKAEPSDRGRTLGLGGSAPQGGGGSILGSKELGAGWGDSARPGSILDSSPVPREGGQPVSRAAGGLRVSHVWALGWGDQGFGHSGSGAGDLGFRVSSSLQDEDSISRPSQKEVGDSRGVGGSSNQEEAGECQVPLFLESRASGLRRGRPDGSGDLGVLNEEDSTAQGDSYTLSVGDLELQGAWKGLKVPFDSKGPRHVAWGTPGLGSELSREQRGGREALGVQGSLEAENGKTQGPGVLGELKGRVAEDSSGSDRRCGQHRSKPVARARAARHGAGDEATGLRQPPSGEHLTEAMSADQGLAPLRHLGSRKGGSETHGLRRGTSQSPGSRCKPGADHSSEEARALLGTSTTPAILSASIQGIMPTWMAPQDPGSTHVLGYLIKKHQLGSGNWTAVNKKPMPRLAPSSLYSSSTPPQDLLPCPVCPKFLMSPTTKDTLTVRAGDTVRVPVPFEATPMPEVTWLKDDLPLPERSVTSTTDGLTQILLPAASLLDSGLYNVVLRSPQGREATHSFLLRVAGPAACPQAPGPILLKEDMPGSVTLQWDPSPDEARNASLHYEVLTRSSAFGAWRQVAAHIHSTCFMLPGVLPGHEYHFRVVARNELGASAPSDTSRPWFIPKQQDKSTAKAKSPKEPDPRQEPRFLVGLKAHLLPQGCACCMSCAVRGCPRPRVTWFRNGQSLEGDSTVYSTNVLGVCSLVIPSVSAKDSGQYQVVAENTLGQAVSTGTLIVTESSP